MATPTAAELRPQLIRSVELKVSTELTEPQQTSSGKRQPRILDALFGALIANEVSPRDADPDLCKDLVVRATRAVNRLTKPKELIAG